MGGTSTPGKVWKGDLSVVYLDPLHAPLLAWIPEQHASPRCERALRGGRPKHPVDPHGLWCDLCVTEDPATATVRLVAGQWEQAA